MIQTDQRAETARKTSPERDRRDQRQTRETGKQAALALEAILNGGGWEQIPAEGVLTLSHTLGNSALLDVLALRDTGPERQSAALPAGPLATEPVGGFGGEPGLSEAPAFGTLSPLGALAPVEA